MKRKWLFMLPLLLIGLVFAGCGNTDKKADTSGKVEIKFAFWGDTLEKESIEKLVGKFNDSNDKIHVTAQQIAYDNYMEKLNTQASTKTLPDIGYMLETSTSEWGKSGQLVDLSELYQSGGVFEDKIEESRYQYSDGKIYGSPAGPGMLTLFYSKKYFDENNIDLPPANVDQAWTWEEFVEILQKLTVDRNGLHPNESGFDKKNVKTYGITNFAGLGYESLLKSNGGGIVSEDGKQILIGKQESIDALEKIQDLMYTYHVMPEPSQASTIPSTDTAMLTDRVAMSITGSWDLRGLGEAVEKKGLELGMGVLPKMGDKVVQMNFGPPIVVFKNDNTTENWEEVQTFLQYLMDPENSLDVINSGLWLPNQNDWYTEEEKLAKWTGQENSPVNKKEALVEGKEKALAKNKAFYCEDTTLIEQIINPALEQVWTGKKEPKKVVEEDILPKLKQQLGDKYEFVE